MNLPTHLATNQAQGVIPQEPIAQFELGNGQNFVYLIIDWETREAAWVDPQKDLRPILEALETHQLKLTRVLLTHTHYDHVAGLPMLARKFPRIPVHVHAGDFHRVPREVWRQVSEKTHRNEAEIWVGNIRIHAHHTPGHSAGECCYTFEAQGRKYLLSGDTLFIRDCGRTDFEDGSDEQMFESLQFLKSLPDDTILLPGHHYQDECASWLGREKETSPPLQVKSVAQLSALP